MPGRRRTELLPHRIPHRSGTGRTAPPASAAAELQAVLEAVIGMDLPARLRCWDGSEAGPADAAATLVVRHPRALRRLLWAPSELGFARAYVSGDLDVEGDVFAALDLPEVISRIAHHEGVDLAWRDRVHAFGAAKRLGVLGPPVPPPPEEVRRQRNPLHTRSSDAAAVSHHYDVGNDFYRLVLGPSMVYSCAYWAQPPGPGYGLEDAQRDKLDLICGKLGLQPEHRLLDIGCGWGSLAMHAAREYGARVVGITISAEQADLARQRVEAAGLGDRVEIRLQDYRDVTDGLFHAISSVGMAEHVGRARLPEYAQVLHDLLRPEGRVLNHAIASVRALPPHHWWMRDRPGFMDSYIFPDGELLPLSGMLDPIEHTGLEVRDDEALREHYGLTLRAWVGNLRDGWDEAMRLAGPARTRTWLLYLAACALAFEHGNLTVHQVLAVKQGERAGSGLPLTRRGWLTG